MHQRRASNIINYTTAAVGLRIEGALWTGQRMAFIAVCPKCGRIGVTSARQGVHRIVVHTGRLADQTVEGIEYCRLGDLHTTDQTRRLLNGLITLRRRRSN